MKRTIRIRQISRRRDLALAYAIRRRVFVREQGVPPEIELDADDDQACHFLAFAAEKPVGTARLVVHGQNAKIGRMAVLRRFRGRGIGRKLLERAIRTARRRHVTRIYLHAQVAAIAFYEAAGFRCTGRGFLEAGIPHRKMIMARATAR